MVLAGRADLWDGRWTTEIRVRRDGTEDSYFSHPVWTMGVGELNCRSLPDAQRLVGLPVSTRGKRKVRAQETYKL